MHLAGNGIFLSRRVVLNAGKMHEFSRFGVDFAGNEQYTMLSRLNRIKQEGRLVEDTELLNLFTDMTRVHTAYVERRLLHLGLHNGQGAIISALGACGPSSQKELAEYRHVSAATVSVMLRRMEKNGLVVRSSSDDGKCNEISLTEEGDELYRTLCREMDGEPARIFDGLTPEELAAAEHIFETISDNLEKMIIS